ncbi:MAG: segregation/condensation protein A [Syntrophaceae bacterium]|nr:segregation/condensation protein A [Syntrophaceae bacterium]
MDYEFKLDQFQGPLDLLLFLIRKNKIDIYDIPIALITEQYLKYLEIIRALNLDEAGEYLVLASTLIHIKSRMLLPLPEEGDAEESEGDPRQELVQQLLEYQVFKDAASALEARPVLERDVFKRGSHDGDVELPPEEEALIEVGIFDLVAALEKVIAASAHTELLEIDLEKISLADRINEIMNILKQSRSVIFTELLGEVSTKKQIIYTFLAILDLIKLRMIKAFQNEASGIIRIFLAVQDEGEVRVEGQ